MTKIYTAGIRLSVLSILLLLLIKGQAQTPMYFKGGGVAAITQTIPLNQASQKTQLIYGASDLTPSPVAGQITKVYFRNFAAAGANATYTNFKLSFTQPAFSAFPNTSYLTNLFVARYEPSLVVTPNSVAGGWFEIALTTPFQYDNTKALVVEIEYSAMSSGIGTQYTNSTAKRISGQVLNAVTGTLGGTWNDFGFDIEPSTPCSGTPTPGTIIMNSALPICPGDSIKLFTTGSQAGSGLTYIWESGPSASGPWTNLVLPESDNANTVKPTVSTYYRAGIACNTDPYQYTVSPVLVKVKPALSGPYTINSANPTDVVDGGTNFQTLADVQSYLDCGSIAGPVTFNVTTGTYTGQLSIGNLAGLSAANPIVINGNGSTFQFASVTGARHIIRLNGAKHVTIKDLTLKSTSTTYGWGVHLSGGADSNRITHCTIDMSAVTSTTSGNSAGVVVSNTTSSVSSNGNNANSISIDSNILIGGYHGVVMYGNTDGTGAYLNRVYDNTIRDFYATGVELGYVDSLLLQKNDISRGTRSTTGGTFAGIQVTAGCKRIYVTSNKIHDTHPSGFLTGTTYGIYFISCDAPSGQENYVYNNVLYKFNGSTGLIYALYNSGSDGVRYYHNSIALDNTGATATVVTRGFYQTTDAANIRFMNNNIFITRGGTGIKTGIYLEASGSSIISNYNNFYVNAASGTNLVGYNISQGYATIALWKSNTSYDANSKSLEPNFTNAGAGDLKPMENALNNAGSFVGIAYDYNDVLRNATTPDIGAFEFDAGPCTDPPSTGGNAIIAVSGSSICPGSNVTLDLANIVPGAGQTYTWQSSATSGSGFTNIGSPSANTDVTITANASMYYRAVVTCGVGSATSAEIQVIVKQPLAGSNTYTISNHDPATATNFISFASAVSAIGCGVTSSTIFTVTNSSYPEQVIFPNIPGMSVSNTIRFNGNGADITFNSNNTNERATVKFNGTKYITLDNFVINATGTTNAEYGFGVQLTNDADNNTISNSTINVAASPATQNSSSFVGVVISGSPTSATAVSSNCDNNKIHHNTINGGLYGVTVFGGTSASGFVQSNSITENIITNFDNYGIYFNGTNNLLVEKNNISRPTRVTPDVFRGVQVGPNNTNAKISKNKIHDPFKLNTTATAATNGIYLDATIASAGNENIVSNNLIYDFYSTGPQIGINDNGTSYTKYYHNTISLDDATSASAASSGLATWGIIFGSSSTVGAVFQNNIITLTRNGGNWGRHGIRLLSETVGVISNNNVIRVAATGGGTAAVGYIGSTPYNTLANWQAANGGVYDANSKSLNPLYVSPSTGDFTPSEPQINNMGANVGIATDINDVARNVTTPDPGAIEFGTGLCNIPPPPGDANLSILTEVCAGTPLILNLSGQDIGSGITYQWESSSNINGPYTSASSVLTNAQYSFNAPASSMYYRAAVTCSGNTSYSDTLQVIVAPLRSGTFTINSGLATGGSNFQTITEAINYIRCGINGPVVFNVEQNTTYNERVTIPAISGTSVTNTITINGNGASIITNPITSARAALILDGTDHVIIDSLNVNVSGGAYGWGILLMNQADSNIIRKCHVVTKKGFTDGSDAIIYAGIAINGGFTSTSVTGNNGNGNLIENNTVEGGYYTIIVYGGGNGFPNYNNTVRNNIVLDAFTAPIYIAFQSDAVVSGNDVSWPTQGAYQGTTYGLFLFNGNSGLLVEKNRIHDMTEPSPTGARIFQAIHTTSTVATAGHENKIINNLVYNINHRGTVYGIYNTGSSYCDIYHNTIVLEGASGSASPTYGFYQTNSATNINFKNNLVYVLRSSGGDKYGIYKNTPASGVTSNNNIFFINSGSNDYVGYQTTPRQTLTDWQATGNDAASKSGIDPLFVDPISADYTPAEPTVNNVGTPVNVLTDILGAIRSSIAPDAGGFEFSPVLPVTWLQFRGEMVETINKLSWGTATETNNKGFELERSADGRNFSRLGFVATKASNGSSNIQLDYSYDDSKPLAGNNYYRLKQVDRDGKYSYSNTILLTRKVKEITLSNVYPNPATKELNVTINSPSQEKVTLIITDLTGKAIMQQSMSIIQGENLRQLNVQSLAAGTYIIKAICANGCEIAVSRFVKQ